MNRIFTKMHLSFWRKAKLKQKSANLRVQNFVSANILVFAKKIRNFSTKNKNKFWRIFSRQYETKP